MLSCLANMRSTPPSAPLIRRQAVGHRHVSTSLPQQRPEHRRDCRCNGRDPKHHKHYLRSCYVLGFLQSFFLHSHDDFTHSMPPKKRRLTALKRSASDLAHGLDRHAHQGWCAIESDPVCQRECCVLVTDGQGILHHHPARTWC